MSQRSRHKKQSYWRLVWRQFKRNRLAVGGLIIVLFLGLVAVLAPFLANDVPLSAYRDGKHYLILEYARGKTVGVMWGQNGFHWKIDMPYIDFKSWQPGAGESAVRPLIPIAPETSSLRERLEGPSANHYLGTDDRGRDVLSRIIWGTRISMSIGFISMGLATLIGVIAGALGGYYGGWVDALLQRIIEIMMCIPTFFFIIILIAFLPPSIFNIMAVIGITGWTGVARLVRGEFLKLRSSDFVTAARATGLSNFRIIFRHMLPNALSPVLVSATFGVAGAILTESGLSFLGFGAPPPSASWGEILKQAQQYVNSAWWLVVFPGAAVFITVTAFNLVGEGLRDAMDPRLRQ